MYRLAPSEGSPLRNGEPNTSVSAKLSVETSQVTPPASKSGPSTPNSANNDTTVDINGEDPSQSGVTLDENEVASSIEMSDAPVPFTKETWWRKTKELAPISISVSAGYLVYLMNGVILLTFVGRIGQLESAAAGLTNFYVAVTGVAFCSGLLAAEDTMCAQAYGAGAYHRVSAVFQRAVALMLIICIPIGVLYLFTAPLLIALKQDPAVAKLAGQFVLIYLPSLPFMLIGDALKRYLVCQGIAAPALYSMLIANLVAVVSGYFMILHTRLGVYGMPIALCISNSLSLIILAIWTIHQKLYVKTWKRISIPELLNWRENWIFFKLGVPGAVMMCAEWIGFEIHGLMAGWLGVTSLAAQAILLNTNYAVFSFPMGLSVGSSVLVGNDMGSGRYREAFLSYIVSVVDIEIVASVIVVVLLAFHRVWGYIFTNVPEVIDQVSGAILSLILFIPADAASGVGGGAIRGVGEQKKAAICNLFAFYCVGVPLGYYLAFPVGFNMGLKGLWLGLAAASYSASAMVHIILWTGDWKMWSVRAQSRASGSSPNAPTETVPLEDIVRQEQELEAISNQNSH